MNVIMTRKNIILLLTAVLTVIPFSSCIMNEKDDSFVEDSAIWYDLAPLKTETQTKAVTAFPTSSTFGSYAYNIPSGKTYDYNSAEGVLYINDAEISYNSSAGHWKCDGKMYSWPIDGSSLTFFSYSPYNLPGLSCTCSGGIRIDDFTVETTLGLSYHNIKPPR